MSNWLQVSLLLRPQTVASNASCACGKPKLLSVLHLGFFCGTVPISYIN